MSFSRYLPVLLLPLAVVGCTRQAAPPAPTAARYTVGAPYEMGGSWSYPREDFSLTEAGLATVIADPRGGRVTANGETYDPGLLTAAHRTLQLPAILRVTNLENGRELRIRVNDRGPAQPGRVLALSRRAAELLGIAGVAQVSLSVDSEASRALAAAMPQPEAVSLAVATAPRGVVESESLAPPPGAQAASRVRQARSGPAVAAGPVEAARQSVPLRLPEELVQGVARPGRLFVQGSNFTSRTDAQRQAARMGGARVEPFGPPRRPEYRVRLGPFASVAEADRALELARRSGVSEARLLVDY
ncbi:septal ring lytic transglycosylase RlpA family protein [Roseomonas sp. USHLN139]|uniref:septal ring lytic transglycosylase RlpA family protein n=1 Tax=Roseomonas sp. USHLN139 TaxID=3081298 RepID=UPI003B01FF09